MRILVAVKRVVDYSVKVRVKPDGSGVDLNNVKMSINPFDDIALEEAVRLKESNIANDILAVSIGQTTSQETLRHALAMGADSALLIQNETFLEPLHIAKILKAITEKEKIDLVIMGKQAIDDDSNQVGQMLAALLQWPQGTFTSKLIINNNRATVTREVDGGLETIEISLPAVITTDLRLNEPRYLSLPNIMKAKQKKIETLSIEDLSLSLKPHQEVLKVRLPEKRKAGIKVESIEQLMKILKDNDKVLP